MSTVKCKCCLNEFYVPKCRVFRSNYCSSDCREAHKAIKKISRIRFCLCCGNEFFPRAYQIKTGAGKYCSIKCRNISVLPSLLTPEAKSKSKQTYLKNLKEGKIVPLKGDANPKWKGGPKASIKRRILSGKANECTKNYRAKNPDKVREWAQKRHDRKVGRLPRGTVKSIGNNQGWICVYCRCDISEKYHVDHIIPLSKGGAHEPSNIQILCPTCNVRKHAKLDFKYTESLSKDDSLAF